MKDATLQRLADKYNMQQDPENPSGFSISYESGPEICLWYGEKAGPPVNNVGQPAYVLELTDGIDHSCDVVPRTMDLHLVEWALGSIICHCDYFWKKRIL